MDCRKQILLFIFLTLNWFNLAQAEFDGTGLKIVIIDSGVIKTETELLSKVVDQLCWSLSDQLSDDSYQFNIEDDTRLPRPNVLQWFDYERASTCKNGAMQDFTSPDAAEIPRRTWHWEVDDGSDVYDWNYFGVSHGTNVANIVDVFASGSEIIAINHTYYNSEQKANPDFPNSDCGVHGPDDSIPDIQRPTRMQNCYPVTSAVTAPEVVNKILSYNNVAAINYSAGGSSDSCNENSDLFKRLIDQGIAIVSSTGNNGNDHSVFYPACNQHVIAVGAIDVNENIVDTTNLIGNVDFFAYDSTTDSFSNDRVYGTSYSAPRVSAAFAVLRQALQQAGVPVTNQTVNQIKYSLGFAANSLGRTVKYTIPTDNGSVERVVPIVNYQVIQAGAACILDKTCLLGPNQNGSSGLESIGYFDGGNYGQILGGTSSSYVFHIDFENLGISFPALRSSSHSVLSNTSTPSLANAPNARDVVLSFDGKIYQGRDNGFRVYVNSVLRHDTGFYFNNKSYEIILHRSYFNSGNNHIRIDPINFYRPWGLTNIKAEFTPIVPLTFGVTNVGQYGYDGNIQRYTGLRTSFDLINTNNDVLLSAVGWDIDTSDETSVFINGYPLGNLSRGPSSGYSARDRFLATKNLLRSGPNIIEFVQRETDANWRGYSDERWAVKDILVQEAYPDLIAFDLTFNEKLLSNRNPFPVTASFSNIGLGSSNESTTTFHVSTDKTITTTDIQIASFLVNTILPNETHNLNVDIQSNKINQGYYLGVCITPVFSETNTSNNCSEGIELKNAGYLPAIIIQILEAKLTFGFD